MDIEKTPINYCATRCEMIVTAIETADRGYRTTRNFYL